MTGTSTSGAEWQGGGEAKALGRIFGPALEDDKDEAPPNKMPPPAAVHEATQDEIELAAQTQITADALKEARAAEHLPLRAGNELLKLQQIFLRVERGRDAVIEQMKDEGHTFAAISAALGISAATAYRRYAALKAKRPLGTDNKALGRFKTWAARKFDLSRGRINDYMGLARNPERRLERNQAQQRRALSAYKIGNAIMGAAPPCLPSIAGASTVKRFTS